MNRPRGKNPTRSGSLLAPYFIFLTLVGSLFEDRKTELIDTDRVSRSAVGVTTFIFEGKMFGIFADEVLWLSRQRSPFNDAFRVEKAKLSMYLLLFYVTRDW